MKTYEQIHAGLLYLRGSATDQPCVRCGDTEKNHQWAYQHNAGGEELRQGDSPYSENLHDHYAAMCRPCHNWLDGPRDGRYKKSAESGRRRKASDPAYAEARRQQLAAAQKKGMAEIARLLREDASFAQAWKDRLDKVHSDLSKRYREDPEFASMTLANARKANAAHAEKIRTDPEYRARAVERGREAALKRRKCSECGMVTHPGPLGSHQKSSRHKGYEDL